MNFQIQTPGQFSEPGTIGDNAKKMPDTCDTDDCEMSLQAGRVTNSPRNNTTVCRPCYVKKSVTRNPMINNSEVGSDSIISDEIVQRHAMPFLS